MKFGTRVKNKEMCNQNIANKKEKRKKKEKKWTLIFLNAFGMFIFKTPKVNSTSTLFFFFFFIFLNFPLFLTKQTLHRDRE